MMVRDARFLAKIQQQHQERLAAKLGKPKRDDGPREDRILPPLIIGPRAYGHTGGPKGVCGDFSCLYCGETFSAPLSARRKGALLCSSSCASKWTVNALKRGN